VLDALAVLFDVLGDRAFRRGSHQKFQQGFAAGNENSLNFLFFNCFFTGAGQAKNLGVEFFGYVQIFASNTNVVNTDTFKHLILLLQ
jgi:hypothetical protein